eukprot:CAMPEP_0174739802 /NCGR_PEP_ID=MMETSP1094-20130205/72196_1 /TAXON_ID=156173 /ORGANISM="Chrysochromulina brevifilum, Strain UTEX LB 985" /LENGTH=350 /DNA_ID=CAMNT_0015943401 /DNA_START=44 /DNA_END=1096 /DNA_ORIENTATION=-
MAPVEVPLEEPCVDLEPARNDHLVVRVTGYEEVGSHTEYLVTCESISRTDGKRRVFCTRHRFSAFLELMVMIQPTIGTLPNLSKRRLTGCRTSDAKVERMKELENFLWAVVSNADFMSSAGSLALRSWLGVEEEPESNDAVRDADNELVAELVALGVAEMVTELMAEPIAPLGMQVPVNSAIFNLNGPSNLVAFHSPKHKRFLSLLGGEVDCTDPISEQYNALCRDHSLLFNVVDAGKGEIALYHPETRSFLRMSSDLSEPNGIGLNNRGGICDMDCLPRTQERFLATDFAGGVRLVSAKHGRYIAMQACMQRSQSIIPDCRVTTVSEDDVSFNDDAHDDTLFRVVPLRV